MTTSLEAEILRFLSEPAEEGFASLALAIFPSRRENPVYAKYCNFWERRNRSNPGKRSQPLRKSRSSGTEFRSFRRPQTKTEFRTSGTTGEGHWEAFLSLRKAIRGGRSTRLGLFSSATIQMLLLMQNWKTRRFPLSRMGGILADYQKNQFELFITKDGGFELDRLRWQIVDREEPVHILARL